MSRPSNWPLPPESIRYMIPRRIVEGLGESALSRGLYPLAMGYYRKAQGHSMLREEHDDFLLIYCIEGQGRFRVGDSDTPINAGDLLLVPQGISHAYHSDDTQPWTIYWVHFHGELALAFFEHAIGEQEDLGYFLESIGVQSQLVVDFETLLEARSSAQDMNTHLFAANQLRQILTHITVLRPLKAAKETRDGWRLDQIHSLMQAHVHERLDLDTLAASVNLSKYHFVKRYREMTGTTPINRFIQLKIERACHLLDTTTNEIKEVAYAVGYEDAYYFSRLFRKQMGVSPSQYRLSRTQGFSYVLSQARIPPL
ncbi:MULTISPECIES: AraC family transcriptional regulator [unclassified Marinobacterium]|uniref:AraC family transcriptional regulator n=2 Tax=unclassified Marinobacterium TaxID=2644139 RepID=UPI001569B5B7|nr:MULTISPECIES: AraC family transcriptional regulator [unclassified Marinobacterium]NRP27880.1 HTH-type transcriptional activator Btr [Marinobacterium sp. xm-d-420]NRP53431.1 HTH-type transcriptional activator Btr [Marinobacterium sp. xm-v-242]NRP77681.1 HTH-type transcriptional activator Btr [Marinobacterium sp. xm-m-383]NRP15141.1 HTH-type transcriptional activator Btr [Marinobacterium sp. xm-a-152]NRP39313.1 HTH-type transcriptional activator Btr [Marinobacterium sp. xm-a-121]